MSLKILWTAGIFIAAVMVGAACSSAEPPASAPAPAAAQMDLPDTDGEAMLAYLRGEDYQESWSLWPGKGEKYQGTEPHGMLLTTYVNQPALDALNGKAGSMPEDSIIVKENYMPDGTFDAITVMYKVAGYNPEHNDWFWTKILADGTVEAEGKVEGCQSCHMARQANDYIYTSSLSE